MTYLISDIERAVCLRFKLGKTDLHIRTHHWRIARPRQIAMFLCRELTKASFPKIGRHFGGRHHTTVMHGQRRIAELIRESNMMGDDVEGVREILRELPSATAKARALAAQPLVVRA